MTSPNNLLQEQYRDEPWKMMVLCIMLNQTHYKQVYKVKDEFFRRWPTAEDAMWADIDEMVEVIRPLGFYNRRTRTIRKFSYEWTMNGWRDIGELCGVGKYGRDSWMIFQENTIPPDVTDKKLKEYIEWITTKQEKTELQPIE